MQEIGPYFLQEGELEVFDILKRGETDDVIQVDKDPVPVGFDPGTPGVQQVEFFTAAGVAAVVYIYAGQFDGTGIYLFQQSDIDPGGTGVHHYFFPKVGFQCLIHILFLSRNYYKPLCRP